MIPIIIVQAIFVKLSENKIKGFARVTGVMREVASLREEEALEQLICSAHCVLVICSSLCRDTEITPLFTPLCLPLFMLYYF